MSVRFGIGEWYGRDVAKLSSQGRRQFDLARRSDAPTPKCPFTNRRGEPIACSKPGGVCSLHAYVRDDAASVSLADDSLGPRITCPNRFGEGDVIRTWIGRELLRCADPIAIDEVPFLQSTLVSPSGRAREVGKIDRVLVSRDSSPLDWCAVEMQAVYFSGMSMDGHFEAWSNTRDGELIFPTEQRRPDYRSSGPKRLMPQLQTKVPTISRWGKRTAVVVDEAFFASIGAIQDEPDVSNADIAWFVVRLRRCESAYQLEPAFVRFTTLERTVEGLVAAKPLTKDAFEAAILRKMARSKAN